MVVLTLQDPQRTEMITSRTAEERLVLLELFKTNLNTEHWKMRVFRKVKLNIYLIKDPTEQPGVQDDGPGQLQQHGAVPGGCRGLQGGGPRQQDLQRLHHSQDAKRPLMIRTWGGWHLI